MKHDAHSGMNMSLLFKEYENGTYQDIPHIFKYCRVWKLVHAYT